MQGTFSGIPTKSKKFGKPKPKKEQIFKSYLNQQQTFYISNVEDMIESKHIARLINAVVNRMNLSYLRKKYEGGGASAYAPEMMLKVWLLGFYYRVYTCRPLEKMLHENIAFIWISGNNRPNFKTLSNFRALLENDIKDLFVQVIEMGISLGIVDGSTGFVDGTIVTADANKHKMIWKKSVTKMLSKIEDEIKKITDDLFEGARKAQEKEDCIYGDKGMLNHTIDEISEEKINELVGKIEKRLKGKRKKNEKEKKQYKDAKRYKELNERNKRYLEQKKILGSRNSYSKTDIDAIGLRDKEDVLRAGYSEVIVSENQFVLNYEVRNCGEQHIFQDAVENCQRNTSRALDAVVADGNFGSEASYAFLEESGIEAYVKHNQYYCQKKKKWQQEKIRISTFRKNEHNDSYVCPNGKELYYSSTKQQKYSNGYIQNSRVYSAKESDCCGCNFKSHCTPHPARSIHVSKEWHRLKKKAEEFLHSDKGKWLCRQRGFQVETIFGDRKHNRNNRRFHTRGLSMVKVESGLYYITHNLRKIWKIMCNIIENPLDGWGKPLNFLLEEAS